MPHFPNSTLAGLMLVLAGSLTAQAQSAGALARPTAVQVTVLSTMLAETRGIGEWGFAALLEVDGRRFLIDTGGRAETVLSNSEELGVDLSTVTDVVLTHNHWDHTAGLVTLRRELAKKNPQAMRTTHVAPGIFAIRVDSKGTEGDGLQSLRRDYEALGGAFVEHSKPTELAPGVWFTGPVPRRHPERNWSGDLRVRTPTGLVEDTIAEDSSIVVDTASGFVVITGCGHAGIVNILEYAWTSARHRRCLPLWAACTCLPRPTNSSTGPPRSCDRSRSSTSWVPIARVSRQYSGFETGWS